MAANANLADQSLEDVDVQSILSSRLEEFKQEQSEHFSKSIYLLTTVVDHIDGKLQERLEQAKTVSTEERIILFPYNLGNSHWIGLIMKFKMNEEIERAFFIDPVVNSRFNREKLQKLFSEIFPDTVLRPRPVQHQIDQTHSALFISENLVKAATSFGSTEFKSSNENYSSSRISDDQKSNFSQ
ncbi:unnamed protein product, partial [Adineta steineri]